MLHALDLKEVRSTNSDLYNVYQNAYKAYIDVLTFKQYNAWNKELRRLREDFRASYNDLQGLRFSEFCVVSRSSKTQSLYKTYITAYYNWLHFDNRSRMQLVHSV